MVSKECLYRILKYIVSIAILFVLFRYIPSNTPNYKDIFIAIGIIMLANIILDLLCKPQPILDHFSINTESKPLCPCENPPTVNKFNKNVNKQTICNLN